MVLSILWYAEVRGIKALNEGGLWSAARAYSLLR